MGVHNGARYLPQALRSILDQTFRDLELIVVDDASTDETAAILASCGDPRLTVLRNEENRGLTRSLNAALAASRGTYIARQDADDRSLPDRLERQTRFLEEHRDVALCGTWARMVDPEGRVVATGRPPAAPDELRQGLLEENKIFHGTMLARRALMEELGGYREAFRYTQDYDLYLRALDGHRLANVPEELYELRFHGGALTSTRQELQHAYRVLARELWSQRRASGRDQLDLGVPVETLLEPLRANADGVEFWRHRALYLRLMGDLAGYRRALARIIRLQPRDVRAYGQLALSLGGEPTLRHADRVLARLALRR